MNDDWRLQIDLDDEGTAGGLADHMRSAELEHELATDHDKRVIVSHEGETIYLYAGDREQLDLAQAAIQKHLDAKGWKGEFELRHWHPVAEDWEDPDVPEPTTPEEKAAERKHLMETEDAETEAAGGLAEFEVRVEFPSHGEARDFAKKLEAEGLQPVRRWRYMVVGAADEDAANELAERIRAEAPADSKVTAEGSLGYAVRHAPPNPFFFLGGLGG
ncbi:MAG TPA: hypothetical protein VJL81_02360 [Solirubrobacterales bacterium]|nr:hypothetical protein [Solirubrobacterales bacterium]